MLRNFREQLTNFADIFTFGIKESPPVVVDEQKLQKNIKILYEDLNFLVNLIRLENVYYPDNEIPINLDLNQDFVPPFIREYFSKQISMSPDTSQLFIKDTGYYDVFSEFHPHRQEIGIFLMQNNQEIRSIKVHVEKVDSDGKMQYQCFVHEGTGPYFHQNQKSDLNIKIGEIAPPVGFQGGFLERQNYEYHIARQVFDFISWGFYDEIQQWEPFRHSGLDE